MEIGGYMPILADYLARGSLWHCRQGRYGILCHNGESGGRKPQMPTRNVVLTKRQEELIETLVDSGRYQNASEVLRDGLRLVEQREAEESAKLEVLRQAAQIGVAALDRGEFREFESINQLRAYLNDLSDKVISGSAE